MSFNHEQSKMGLKRWLPEREDVEKRIKSEREKIGFCGGSNSDFEK